MRPVDNNVVMNLGNTIMAKNPKWNKQNKIIRATQVAFELEQKVAQKIQELAAKDGLNSSSQIRKLIGLPYSPPKRPRLTVSLSLEDYKKLGTKYNIDANDTLEIKRMIMRELIEEIEK